jgi:DNA helicase-2/ATP-dependent DNA helicase PcrA
MDDPAQMEEERRLVYVGITRAMRGLTLVYAVRRLLYGNAMSNQPSRFLLDVPAELVQSPLAGRRTVVSSPAPAAAVRTPGPMRPRPDVVPVRPPSPVVVEAAAAQQYFPGDRVFHPAFGTGVVVTSELRRGDEEVTVAFEGKGVKKLSASYAPLQRS